MSNQIDGNGISIQTFSEILDELINGNSTMLGLKQIYGDDINVESNSPDGQWVNNLALMKRDILELIVQVYTSKDPDQAVGIDLDSVSQLCGIQRTSGTYTEVNILINTDRAISLNGQDTASPFTVSDSTGNQFQLIETSALVSGNNTLAFRAVDIGAVQVQANTITVQDTVILGVQSVNNPSAAYQTGVNQETDAQLRLRRQRSVSMPAQGVVDGLTAGLLTIDGLVDAVVYENTSNTTDSDGIPAKSIWVIADGGAVTDVANMIYNYRTLGCGMHGGTSGVITLPNGSSFTISFDRAVEESLYIKFQLTSINGGSIDSTYIKEYLVNNYLLSIYQIADITSITSLIHVADNTLVVSNCQVSSDNSTWFNSILPASKKNKFALSTARITVF